MTTVEKFLRQRLVIAHWRGFAMGMAVMALVNWLLR